MDTYQCPECNKDYNSIYCQPCNSGHFRDDFKNWTSDDEHIDKLIQESQLNASSQGDFIQWIEYSNFVNIEHIADGGFGKVYKSIWRDGRINSEEDEIQQAEY